MSLLLFVFVYFFFNDTATTEIYTSTHSFPTRRSSDLDRLQHRGFQHDRHSASVSWRADDVRSEEHTSELQSLMRISYAVFCLKKKKKKNNILSDQKNKKRI